MQSRLTPRAPRPACSGPQVSALEKKGKTIQQPAWGSDAPRIPAPNSKFSRDQVKVIQDLFIKLSQDGCMGTTVRRRGVMRTPAAAAHTGAAGGGGLSA